MAWALWALTLIYGGSLALLVGCRLIARRSRPLRRFLFGEQSENGAAHVADGRWRHRDA